ADHLARQGRAAFVTATHTLRGKSGKESPGDKSFIPAPPACSVTRFLWSNACPPCLAEASQFITFVGFQRHGLGVPPTRGGHQAPDSDNSELVLPMKVAKKKGWAT